MSRVVKKQGFTVIELMLAMTFISFLLLGVAMTVMQIGGVYNKGMTLKEINQVSRSMNDDISRTVRAAGVLDPAVDYILTPSKANPASGRLCLGNYTYIWNYEKAIDAKDPDLVQYVAPPAGTAPIRFVKVPDAGKAYCEINGTSGALKQKNIVSADIVKAQELLKNGDHELGVHQFDVKDSLASTIDGGTGQQLYSIDYTIGTNKIAALNLGDSANISCKAPGKADADPLYCNVQQFSLVIRAGGGVN